MRLIACLFFALATAYGAGLEFPRTLKEVHAPADADKVSAEFEFTNRSEKPVTVRKYDAACSCMAVKIKDGKMTYEPGESGLIRADFDMGNFSGTVDKVVLLWLDDAPEDGDPSVTLTVKVHIPVLVETTPKTLKWDLGGELETKTIRLRMNYSKPIRVKSVKSSSDVFVHKLKTIEEGKAYDLEVTPRDLDTPALAIFRIETDCEVAKHRLQQAFGVIRKPMSKP